MDLIIHSFTNLIIYLFIYLFASIYLFIHIYLQINKLINNYFFSLITYHFKE